MNKKLVAWSGLSLILCIFCFLPFANADNTITFNSTKSFTQGASGSDEHLTAYSISGVRNTLYFSFDFSKFPSDSNPDFAVFYIISYAAMDPCNVEAYYYPSADWVQTGSVPNSTLLSSTGAINYVSQGDEQYAFTSNSFIQAVKQACLEKSGFTVCLKAKANAFGDSIVLFNPDATLDVSYTKVSSVSPTPTIPEYQPLTVILTIAIASTIVAVTYKTKR